MKKTLSALVIVPFLILSTGCAPQRADGFKASAEEIENLNQQVEEELVVIKEYKELKKEVEKLRRKAKKARAESTESTESKESNEANEFPESKESVESKESTESTEANESTESNESTEENESPESKESVETKESNESTESKEQKETSESKESVESKESTESTEANDPNSEKTKENPENELEIKEKQLEKAKVNAFNAYIGLSQAYSDLGSYRKSLKALDAAEELEPSATVVYQNRFVLYKNYGKYEEALEEAKILLRDPSYWIINMDLANIYLEMGQKKEAQAAYRKWFSKSGYRDKIFEQRLKGTR